MQAIILLDVGFMGSLTRTCMATNFLFALILEIHEVFDCMQCSIFVHTSLQQSCIWLVFLKDCIFQHNCQAYPRCNNRMHYYSVDNEGLLVWVEHVVSMTSQAKLLMVGIVSYV